MSVIHRERLIVIAMTETIDLSNGGICEAMRTASNVFNRDELIGLLTRAIWLVGHDGDVQLDSDDANDLVEAARQPKSEGDGGSTA